MISPLDFIKKWRETKNEEKIEITIFDDRINN